MLYKSWRRMKAKESLLLLLLLPSFPTAKFQICSREVRPFDGGRLPAWCGRRARGRRVYGRKVSEGRRVGEEESRLAGLKPQVDGTKWCRERRT